MTRQYTKTGLPSGRPNKTGRDWKRKASLSKQANMRKQKSDHFLPDNLKTQAGRIIAKFGGAMPLHRALLAVGNVKDLTVIYRWDKPKAKGGTGGVIPNKNIPDIQRAARHEGILLTDKDLSPVEHR